MKRFESILMGFAASLLCSRAMAQPDVEKPLSNVLLLVDTSGSMDQTPSGSLPICNPGNSASTNEKSRWIDLVEVLTGTVDNYSCFAEDRTTAAFKSEYSLGVTPPYDFNYNIPFHRILSGNCTTGPGVLPAASTPWDFPSKAINTFSYSSGLVTRPVDLTTHPGCANFSQRPDGILDIYKQRLRFGLMTFDSHENAGTGVSVGLANYSDGVEGTWSYYVGSPTIGRPANCMVDLANEVGARNPQAPPWEGRLIAFGPSNAATTDTDQRNEWIQQELLATRPYGATPLAGMIADARDFLWNDTTADPFNSGSDFGPRADPNWLASECRKTTIIILSDGEPNLDLRPSCENIAEGGICPYEKPEDVADTLLNSPPTASQSVETVVIGFGLPQVTIGSENIPCSELTDDQCASDPNNTALKACCTLNEIAAAGGPPDANGDPAKAYFASNSTELREVFSQIISQLSTNISTRTGAVFSSAISTSSGGGFQFNSGFTPSAIGIWKGSLTRSRTICVDGISKEQEVDALAGDDFIANVNSKTGPARRFYTAVPTGSPSNSLRPNLASTSDGLGLSTAATTDDLSAAELVTTVTPTMMNVTASTCGTANSTACRDRILNYLVGQPNDRGEGRCLTAASCNLVGGIFHSTPRVVSGRPAAALRDESYDAFVALQATNERPSVLYTSSVDGFLHAFLVAPFGADETKEVNSRENNLLWSFLPPAVMPVLQAQYPNTPATLLDGEPIVEDVVTRVVDGNDIFERTVEDARAGAGEWRTVLVQAFGAGQVNGGYFALDVTNPDPATGGPKLLWQLTRDAAGNALFGSSGTPLITTLFIQKGTDATREVAVAVLPGGDAGTATSTLVAAGSRRTTTDPAFAARAQVRSYTGANEARSLTIVRLDNGEILPTFRGVATSSAISTNAAVTSLVTIPAPIVGTPMAYPGRTGDVADRIFVGDREGRMWVVNVSSKNPANWSMNVLFDAFWDKDSSLSQPIETPPTLSVDNEGRTVVIFATGDQRVQSGSASTVNRVVSVTEKLNTSLAFETQVNWVETLGGISNPGERVTGRLSLFDSAVYFATSTPPAASAAACVTGSSRIWGVDFNKSIDEIEGAETIDPESGPAGRLPNSAEPENPLKSLTPEAGIVFGVGVEQQPTCSTSETASGDPYSGLGSYTTLSNIAPGKFFLVYQVGGATGSGDLGRVTTIKTELQPPQHPARIDSWAFISE